MSWFVRTSTPVTPEVGQEHSQTAYKVTILYDGEPLYEIRYGTSADQVSDEVETELKAAEEAGNWWIWRGSGGSVRKIRASFIAGFEVRPAGGKGTWSG